jgi:hypothetical protein
MSLKVLSSPLSSPPHLDEKSFFVGLSLIPDKDVKEGFIKSHIDLDLNG